MEVVTARGSYLPDSELLTLHLKSRKWPNLLKGNSLHLQYISILVSGESHTLLGLRYNSRFWRFSIFVAVIVMVPHVARIKHYLDGASAAMTVLRLHLRSQRPSVLD